jgi:carboxylesterase type B
MSFLRLAFLCAVVADGALVPDTMTVETGDVLGVRDTAAGVRTWLGVPFADTTAGVNAWAAPARRPAWSPAVFNATAFGPGCFSPHHNPDVAKNMSFDCLNANIFAPVLAAGETVPVMVFLYGGAYLEGDNQGPFGIYGGAVFASTQKVAVVALGYRLGAFGWLAALDGSGIDGNFGLMDQIAGLQWVQRNIAAFGGDPTRVTLAGQSAGAYSVAAHLASPLSAGLFRKSSMLSWPSSIGSRSRSQIVASVVSRAGSE